MRKSPLQKLISSAVIVIPLKNGIQGRCQFAPPKSLDTDFCRYDKDKDTFSVS